MISHHIRHGSIDSLVFLKPVVIIFSFLVMFHVNNHISVCIAQETNQYEKCNTNFVCGNPVNVGYPFWGDHHSGDANSRPEYCGLPGYKLDCLDGDVADIQISDESYRVFEINPITQVMNITSKDIVDDDDDDACPSKYPIRSFDSAVFKLAPDAYQLITLYFDCSDNDISDRYKFSCQINDTGAGSTPSNDAYFWFDMATRAPGFTPPNFSSCNKTVKVPIMSEFLGGLMAMPETLPAVIKQGFNVTYVSAESGSSVGMCLTCKSTGGTCGYNVPAKSPTCFCSDGSNRVTCAGSTPESRLKRKITIGVCAAVGASLLTILAFLLFRRWRRKNDLHKNSTLISRSISPDLSMQADPEKGSSYFNTPIFTYKELEEATNNFDSSKELGDGGFGTVYYGVLKDGRAVAVKRLYENNCKRVEQFMNEVSILSLLRHTNLVSLYGCTSRHSRELLLVYEYVSNGTVADHLHGEHSSAGLVTWPIRLSIAIESAGALVYLHASDIVHRDVKTNNILLDKNFHVKVADFGLSRLFPTDVTHVSTAPQGTPGYVDPEYYQCYQLTDKSDVYSFGVVLIELISSKPAVDINRHRHEINLSNMAINKIHNDALHELVDISLGFDSNANIRRTMTLVAELAFRCLQQDSDARPSMAEVLEVLKEIEVEYSKVVKPGDMDIPGKDVRLLKNNPPVSPNSVTDKWASISSTPNTSC